MLRRPIWLALGAALLLAGGGLALVRHLDASAPPRIEVLQTSPELTRIEQDLSLYTSASKQDPFSATFPAHSARLYLQRAALSGDAADAKRAEELARASLAQRTSHNGTAFVTLVASLLEQHRFQEAAAVAKQLVAGQPDVDAYRALLGETQLEVGDYDAARASFASLKRPVAALNILAALARWEELQGREVDALRLLRTAREAGSRQGDIPKDEIAWLSMREGDMELRRGHRNAASEAYGRALAAAPWNYRVQAAMSRLSMARQRWTDAIAYGDASIATALDPGTLGLIADAYAARGDSARAAEYEQTLEVAVSAEPGAYHRAWSLYMLDHGRNIPDVLRRAEEELTTRRDIYGHDLVAWARYKAGRHADAAQAMAPALRLGTRDPLLLYHAGMIARAVGDAGGAAGYLGDALALDPWSRPEYTRRARAVMDSLDIERDPARTVVTRLGARLRRSTQRASLRVQDAL